MPYSKAMNLGGWQRSAKKTNCLYLQLRLISISVFAQASESRGSLPDKQALAAPRPVLCARNYLWRQVCWLFMPSIPVVLKLLLYKNEKLSVFNSIRRPFSCLRTSLGRNSCCFQYEDLQSARKWYRHNLESKSSASILISLCQVLHWVSKPGELPLFWRLTTMSWSEINAAICFENQIQSLPVLRQR